MEIPRPPLKQHSPTVSFLFHLVPGLPILAGIFLFSQPSFVGLFGLDLQLGPLVGYLTSIFAFLILVQIGILFSSGKKLNGIFSLKGVIGNLEKSSKKQYLVIIPILLAYNILLFVVLAPRIQPFIVDSLFAWYPEEYNFQLFIQRVLENPKTFAGYRGIGSLLSLYILLSCLLGPFVEELYFRGYLLPRMHRYAGKWAPLINTVLFSLYHFFSPWENPIRIIALLPVVYIVWRKRDIRFGIATHVVLNTVGGVTFFVSVLL
jgi:membrane protease YdiL (CAAX protease family)